MRRIVRWLMRGLLAVIALVLLLLSPVGFVELMCRPTISSADRASLVGTEWLRPEARTLLTYPEWHIVHAYDDYAAVIATGDPHDFNALRSTADFWGSLCSLSQASGPYGGFPLETKQMVYTIGVSFTAELFAKTLYETTFGRIATWVRGSERAPLDDLSARQARDYATFLQQVPWYKWDFRADRAALIQAATPAFRDRERSFALGIEYGTKALYAKVIAKAVRGVGEDALRLRSVVTGLDAVTLAAMDEVDMITTRPQGIEIETPRYRAFTEIAKVIADAGGTFVEIAGNDDILFTAIVPSDGAVDLGPEVRVLHRFARQGNSGDRVLAMVKVSALGPVIRGLAGSGAVLEHIHDY
jgi:hypothetical protein